jgi:hypothetical protein
VSYNYALADHGRTLATRSLAEGLRTELVRTVAEEDVVVLDFSEIRSMSHSFADEFVARLVEEVKDSQLGFEITVAGACADVERVLRRALERRGLDLPMLV